MTTSSFSGAINEIDFISVDNFVNINKSAYFLSHYHSDHFVGLNDSRLPRALKRNEAFIYGSEVTIAIVKNDQKAELIPYLKTLKLGRNTVTIKRDDEEIYLKVTTLPAGHSLGSVMFLFEYQKTILYTGDFRISQNDIERYTHLHRKDGSPIHIDVMYIDTTFQNVPSFPRRSDVVRDVVSRVKDWLNADTENRVYLSTSANYAYEYVCNEIFDATNIKTYLGDAKWIIYSQFPKEMYGITNDPTSRVHMGYKSYKPVQNTREQESKILTILFSAQYWSNDDNNESFVEVYSPNTIRACFATHCGRDELLNFVNYLKPSKKIGFRHDFISKSPVKMATAETPLKIRIGKSSKRPNDDSNSNFVTAKKLSQACVKILFDSI